MYPFEERIMMKISIREKGNVTFPLEVRIPSWCQAPVVKVNGAPCSVAAGADHFTIDRPWKTGDSVELSFPMNVKTSRWYENSLSVERGPLVYALRIEENWVKKTYDEDISRRHGKEAWEVYPATSWNYALIEKKDMAGQFEVKIDGQKMRSGIYPWSLEGTPIELTAPAKEVSFWKLYDGHEAGPLPFSPILSLRDVPVTTVRLVPYGCTTLRIAEFPTAY